MKKASIILNNEHFYVENFHPECYYGAGPGEREFLIDKTDLKVVSWEELSEDIEKEFSIILAKATPERVIAKLTKAMCHQKCSIPYAVESRAPFGRLKLLDFKIEEQ